MELAQLCYRLLSQCQLQLKVSPRSLEQPCSRPLDYYPEVFFLQWPAQESTNSVIGVVYMYEYSDNEKTHQHMWPMTRAHITQNVAV